jgi:hypothetical protein
MSHAGGTNTQMTQLEQPDPVEAQDATDASSSDALPPRVRVTYPDGGEVLAAKSRVTIRWTSGDDRGIVMQRVQLSLDGGKTHRDLCEALDGAAHSVEWVVPTTPCERARIRVLARDAAGNLGMDVSNGCFTITEAEPDRDAPQVAVLGPAEGTVLQGGQQVEVRWRSNDATGVASHRVLLSVDGGASFNLVARGLAGSADRLTWTVPRVATTRARLRVEALDDSGNRGAALGPSFTIQLEGDDAPAWAVE